MVTLAIVGVLLAVGVPSFSQFVEANRHTSAVNDLIADINLARAEAIKRGQNQVVVCASSTGAACNSALPWNSGWMVFYDNNNSGTYAAADNDVLLKVHGSFPSSVTTSTTPANTGVFSYSRLGTLQGGLTQVVVTNTKAAKTRYLCFATTGRLLLAKNADCT